jgi:hypothetical protein
MLEPYAVNISPLIVFVAELISALGNFTGTAAAET